MKYEDATLCFIWLFPFGKIQNWKQSMTARSTFQIPRIWNIYKGSSNGSEPEWKNQNQSSTLVYRDKKTKLTSFFRKNANQKLLSNLLLKRALSELLIQSHVERKSCVSLKREANIFHVPRTVKVELAVIKRVIKKETKYLLMVMSA